MLELLVEEADSIPRPNGRPNGRGDESVLMSGLTHLPPPNPGLTIDDTCG